MNHTSGGMYAYVTQPCEGVNINTNGGDKSFGKWSLVQPTNSMFIQDQHQFKSHHDFNIDTGSGNNLFAQRIVVKSSDFLKNHNQH